MLLRASTGADLSSSRFVRCHFACAHVAHVRTSVGMVHRLCRLQTDMDNSNVLGCWTLFLCQNRRKACDCFQRALPACVSLCLCTEAFTLTICNLHVHVVQSRSLVSTGTERPLGLEAPLPVGRREAAGDRRRSHGSVLEGSHAQRSAAPKSIDGRVALRPFLEELPRAERKASLASRRSE